MNNGILVTPRSLSMGGIAELQPLVEAGYQILTPTPGSMPNENDLLEMIPGCVGWLAGVEPVSDKVIYAAQNLKVISRNGTGIDNLPMQLLNKRGIAVERAVGTNARGVAELALAFILAGLRSIVPTHEGIRNGQWPRIRGREICDSTIGVIGLGAIGKTVTELCLVLGAKVIGYDPFIPKDAISHPRFEHTELNEIFVQSDVITLHCPMPENGKPLMNKDVFNSVKQGLVLVNTARAGLVDEDALLNALDALIVSNYLTDVFDEEPPKPSALTRHPRVTLTSHIGGFTGSSVSRSTALAVENILKILDANETRA